MPRLLAYRGEALYREIELTGRTVRIGRGSDNDLILEDAGKSVSRNHAEIRYENGRYVLVDRDSQNGVWVSGSRLPQVLLEPSVVASVGPYRLMLDSSIDTTVATESGLAEAGTLSRETAVTSQPRPPKIPPSKVSVPIASATQKKIASSWLGGQPMWLLAALGGLVVGALVLAVVLFVGGQSEPPPPAVDQFAGMEERIKTGDCAAVLTDLQAILAANPTEPRALELKGRAEACQTAALPPTPPVVPTIEERLKTAAVMVESGDCQGALSQHINPALEIDPLNVDATELKKKAESCGQPPPTPLPPTATNQPPKTLPPEQGGLPRVAGENEKNYLSRVETMKARYAEAESALSAADYPKAATLFDGILRDAGPQYMNVMEKLAEAKGRSKEAAQKSIQAARDLEKKGEWEGAAEAYRRARLLDSSVNVDGDIKRISGLRIAEGRKVCDEANARYSYSRTAEALQLYQEAVKLLPQDDPCVGIARERFPSLRR